MRYKHTQIGYAVIVPVIVSAIVAAYIGAIENHDLTIGVAGLLVATAGFFGSLTVIVDVREIEVRFGPGLIKKTFPLSEIRSAKHVRHKWYNGWGFRKLPKGWLMNVSGLDCIEIEMKDESVHRIGTDEPKKLLRHLENKLGSYEWHS